ncbi:MAG: hypothetical protein QUS11_04930 [Candidatus Fermentibacter sp.]|nr:hypothetical protein [Candidatus Fermentibacter sp.]
MLLLAFAALASFPPMTVDLTGADPGTWEEWAAGEPSTVPFSLETIIGPPAGAATDFAVLIEEGLADSLVPGTIERWVADMEPWVGGVLVAEASYSTPEELRAWLLEMHAEGLEGVVLVGDLPVAWVMLDNAFARDSETFPCDYFYMDLDGLWEDLWIGYPSAGIPGSDGKYDTWDTSGMAPEIYCARIITSKTTIGAEDSLLQAYLDRNHEWRTAGDPLPFQALCYVDNDWAVWGGEFRDAMMQLYPVVELINDEEQTCGTDYEENRLPVVYEWISPFVHSGPTFHQWNPGPETYWNEVTAIDPPARFYNLFACSNSRFTTPRNMGSIYVFGTTHGLASVGSTKTGSMLSFEPFYATLGAGGNLGQAFRDWWTFINSGGFTPYEMSWHLGMVLIGDPTLVPASPMLGVPGGDPGYAVPSMSFVENPCRGSVAILLPGSGEALVRVFDPSGRLVASRTVTRGGGPVEIDMPGMPRGVYTAVSSSEGGSVSGRFALL